MTDLVITGNRVLTEDGVRPAAIRVAEGKIEAVDAPERSAGEVRCIDAGNAMVFPGVVDTHVHINEPGTDWEGFETATRAAAAGGVTTLVDMPLNSLPVTTCPSALQAKLHSARRRARVDYGFWGGVVPGNEHQLEPLLAAGVLGFKAFLVDSGLPEFPSVSDVDLRPAMRRLAAMGVPLLVHAEEPAMIAAAAGGANPPPMQRYGEYLTSRPDGAEVAAIERMIRLCRKTGCAVHIVHLATVEALPALAQARADGLAISVETCPHYLTFAAEEIADGATLFKCAPPIRGRSNREGLWRALLQGKIDLVASDHSPCPSEAKRLASGDFRAAWGGIASLQLTLPALWTGAASRGVSLGELARWLCEEPARLAGLAGRKGRIAPGYDADLVIWDPDATWVVAGAALHHRHPVTAYEGRTLRGRVVQTVLRGQVVFDRGRFPGPPRGRWVKRR